MALISVIIPTYNRAKFLPYTIESVLAQTFQDIEIIVVDDGSTDDTESVIAPYFDRINYVKQNNAERSAARNHGLRLASGELIAFLDSDDIWLPSKLEKQVAYLNVHPNVGLVYTWLNLCDMEGRPLRLVTDGRPLSTQHGDSILNQLLLRNFIVGGASTVVVRRSAIDTAGWFDENLRHGEDWDLWLRISLTGRVGFIPEPLALYRVDHINTYEKQFWLEVQKSYIDIVEKILLMVPEALLDVSHRRAALAQAHWHAAKIYYSVAKFPKGQEELLKAIQLDPEFFSEANPDLPESIASWAKNLYEDSATPKNEALTIINDFFANLPRGAEFLSGFRNHTLSMYYASNFFQQDNSLEWSRSIHNLVSMIRYHPRWLLNRGVWAMGLRAIVGSQ